jgi:hypothetical protein
MKFRVQGREEKEKRTEEKREEKEKRDQKERIFFTIYFYIFL